MIGRLFWGILNGLLADLSIRLNRLFKLGPDSWLARRAAFAILRAYSLGGGIDDGIAYLFDTWGDEGRRCLTHLLDGQRVPEHYRWVAELLAGPGDW